MKGIERDKLLKEISACCQQIKAIPIKQLDNDVKNNLIIARNFLRAVEKSNGL